MTVHPEGIPLTPVGQVTPAAFTKVPVGEIFETQYSKQFEADISVAKHLILVRDEQFLNIYEYPNLGIVSAGSSGTPKIYTIGEQAIVICVNSERGRWKYKVASVNETGTIRKNATLYPILCFTREVVAIHE